MKVEVRAKGSDGQPAAGFNAQVLINGQPCQDGIMELSAHVVVDDVIRVHMIFEVDELTLDIDDPLVMVLHSPEAV